jgi:predicted transcriptional regulator
MAFRGREMEQDPAQERQRAHDLLDMLPDNKLAAVRGLLEVMTEPLSLSLASAAEESEEVAPETVAAIERGRASLARGEGIAHEQVLREFGLSE